MELFGTDQTSRFAGRDVGARGYCLRDRQGVCLVVPYRHAVVFPHPVLLVDFRILGKHARIERDCIREKLDESTRLKQYLCGTVDGH